MRVEDGAFYQEADCIQTSVRVRGDYTVLWEGGEELSRSSLILAFRNQHLLLGGGGGGGGGARETDELCPDPLCITIV